MRHITFLMLFSITLTGSAMAQQIKFGLYATDNIDLSKGSIEELDFNAKQALILAGSTVNISLTDNAAAVLVLTGRADLDVTVTVTSPATLDLDAGNKIPLALRYAYSNKGASDESTAKTQAVEVPAGFTSITFPILRRASGPPGAPPAPNHSGASYPTATSYLFFYGILGAVPAGAAAGEYSGSINVYVEYSKY